MTIRFDIDLGLNSLKGVLTLKDEGLYIEWRRYDLFDAPVSALESLCAPFTELGAVNIKRKLWRPIVEITANSASTFAQMPLPAGDLAVLRAKVARTDRDRAEAWGAEANLRIADAMPGGILE